MNTWMQALEIQRWDDHRYYHHSTINQTLHLVSAVSFVCSYVLLFTDPVAAVFIGWLVAMVTRQIGHFFFEPKGYDEVNRATHAYKEAVKVGYNLRRKVFLLAIWAVSPVVLLVDPTLFGLLALPVDTAGFVRNIAYLWIGVAIGGLLFRTVQLCYLRDVQTGLVWLVKILTDPFHDIMLYRRAPLYLLRGQLLDPCRRRVLKSDDA